MSGYDMGLTENMYLSLALIVGSLVFGSTVCIRGYGNIRFCGLSLVELRSDLVFCNG